MKSKLLKNLAVIASSLLTLFAVSVSVSACAFSLYQPEEPKCLREDDIE